MYQSLHYFEQCDEQIIHAEGVFVSITQHTSREGQMRRGRLYVASRFAVETCRRAKSRCTRLVQSKCVGCVTDCKTGQTQWAKRAWWEPRLLGANWWEEEGGGGQRGENTSSVVPQPAESIADMSIMQALCGSRLYAKNNGIHRLQPRLFSRQRADSPQTRCDPTSPIGSGIRSAILRTRLYLWSHVKEEEAPSAQRRPGGICKG